MFQSTSSALDSMDEMPIGFIHCALSHSGVLFIIAGSVLSRLVIRNPPLANNSVYNFIIFMSPSAVSTLDSLRQTSAKKLLYTALQAS